ncbi:hypothetical protein Tcan_06621 [Toxocara canis]|uniref:Uncharacterized protein n=1 Tax=Toxocara canis TaxID=6265 RepID=A0A0B2UXF0_TOXCA|nr:hypothetical protein Tcan_06621 [Toxocara canis]
MFNGLLDCDEPLLRKEEMALNETKYLCVTPRQILDRANDTAQQSATAQPPQQSIERINPPPCQWTVLQTQFPVLLGRAKLDTSWRSTDGIPYTIFI